MIENKNNQALQCELCGDVIDNRNRAPKDALNDVKMRINDLDPLRNLYNSLNSEISIIFKV